MVLEKSELKVPWLGQVGIVVRDIEETIRYYEGTFGIGPWAVFEGEPERCIEKGEEISFRGRMAMAQSGLVQIELIQILQGRTIHTDFLEEHGEGIHHLGFFVRNLEDRIATAKRKGIEVLQRGTLSQLGLKIEYAYLDTKVTGGVILEYIEPRLLGIPFSMRLPVMRLGSRLAAKGA